MKTAGSIPTPVSSSFMSPWFFTRTSVLELTPRGRYCVPARANGHGMYEDMRQIRSFLIP